MVNSSPEAIRARRYRKEHPEKTKAAVEKYRKNNKEKRAAYLREYRNKNPEKTKEWTRKNYNSRKERRRRDPVKYLWSVAKERARKNNIPFNIAVEDIVVNTTCPIIGERLDLFTNKIETSMSLDRVDNAKGYVKGNVQIISRKGNLLKNNATLEQVKSIVKYMESCQCQ